MSTTYPKLLQGVRAHESGRIVHLHFASLAALAAQAEQRPSKDWLAAPASRKENEEGWSGTDSLQESVSRVREGWPEGRKRLIRGMIDLADLSEGQMSLRSEGRDVYGYRPDVALYCAGDPAHMVVAGDQHGPSAPFVDLVMQCGYSCVIDAQSIGNFGIALASLVDATESAGRRVRVSIASSIKGDAGHRLHIRTQIKGHSEALDLDRLAFALSCPSVKRRLMFSILEQGMGFAWFVSFARGYGQPAGEVPLEPGEVFVPSVQFWKGKADWSTPATAYQTMKTALIAALEGTQLEAA